MESASSVLVPPRRLGVLLREARLAADYDLDDLAVAAGISPTELDDVERGRVVLDDDRLTRIVGIYGIERALLVPPRARLVIDLDEDLVEMVADAGAPEVLGSIDGTAASADAVLTRYLALVYRLRGVETGVPIPLRDVDLDVLATALVAAPADVERRLGEMMADGAGIDRDRRRLRRRLLLPLAGVVVAATGVGTLVLAVSSPPPEVADRGTAVGDAAVLSPPPEVADRGTAVGDAAVLSPPPEVADRGTAVGDAAVLSPPPADG